MNYIVIELQTNNGTTAIVPPVTYSDRNQAESKFHQILMSAAVSQVEVHTAVMMTDDGRMVRNECYKHPIIPEETEEQEEQ